MNRKYREKSLNLGRLRQYQINKLQELKFHNSKDMVLPLLHILAKGLDAVMRWSERRLGSSEHIRVQDIILSVQELLRQVGNHFQEGVKENGEYYYQFLPEALWNVFLPLLEHIQMKSEDNANFFYFPSVATK